MLALGVLILMLGIAAMIIAALAANFTLSWVSLLVGVLQLVEAYQTRRERGVVWRVINTLVATLLLSKGCSRSRFFLIR